jgi:ATP-dependent exoDNAse (exonuclease V) beta subunit
MEEDAFTGAITYAPSEAVKPGDGSQAVSVTLYNNKDDLAEAEKVVQIIREAGKGETTAVLCLSRAQLGEVVKALKKEGIGFSAVDFDPLYATPAIQDLLALTRALCHPFDKIAWLAVLRAPWCGLSLSDLLAVTRCPDESPMPELLKDEARLTKLSHDGRARLDGFMKKIEKAIYLKGRVGFRRLLEGAWTELGGPACAAYYASRADTEAFFDIVGLIGNWGGIDVQLLEERVKTLYADSEKAGASITLMTVHKAKGLEFDNVIIPGAGKRAKNDDKQLILWLERGADIFLAPVEKKDSDEPNPLYDYLRSFNKKRAELERTRLFYVACTRAKKRLYILGQAKLEYDKDAGAKFIKSDARSFLKSVESVLNEGMYVGVEDGAPKAQDKEQKPVLSLSRLPAGWALPTPANRITLDAEDKTAQLSIEPEFYWAGEMARFKGTAAHAYLCRIAREGLAKWDVEQINRETGSIKAMLQSLGLGKDEAQKAAKEVANLLCASVGDDYGRWALDAHGEGAVEMQITGVIDGAVVRAVIDRTFIDAGVRWIIDYKTGAHEGGSVEEFIEREKERYRPQLERYEKLLRLSGETREIKKGLYYPALSKWAEL